MLIPISCVWWRVCAGQVCVSKDVAAQSHMASGAKEPAVYRSSELPMPTYQEGQVEPPPLVEQTPDDGADDDPHPRGSLLPSHHLPELLRRREVVGGVREQHGVLRRLPEPHADAEEQVGPEGGAVALRDVLNKPEEDDEEALEDDPGKQGEEAAPPACGGGVVSKAGRGAAQRWGSTAAGEEVGRRLGRWAPRAPRGELRHPERDQRYSHGVRPENGALEEGGTPAQGGTHKLYGLWP